jgi:3,4-dihydroxy 2-butanone 4-phosphate synthase/GTP cyclohydrolase II
MKRQTQLPSFISAKQAIEEIRQGRFVIVLDDENRENEGDLVIAADKITPEAINFMISYGRGLVCMPIASEIADRLSLPMMVKSNTSKHGTAFTVSIGAKQGVTTGISAYDRARTVQVAINPQTTAEDLSYPGHIFPIRAVNGGVLARQGHTEASVDLARLAGLTPAAVICEVLNEDGTMARRDDLAEVGLRHGISLVTIADLVTYRINHETVMRETAQATLPTRYGDATIKIFESALDGVQHTALVYGNPTTDQPTLVRIHSECVTGDVLGSTRCDCGEQLATALEKISQEGGVLLYMNQEGRGIGLANKIKAYALQDTGMDTVEANHSLGFAADQRDYGLAAQILKLLGIQKIRLLTNNPKKIAGIQRYAIEVAAREPIEMQPTQNNVRYLNTKRDKLGHLLSLAK